ncbi:uncharacterized protein LOC133194431 [Saccostrea echinata]|uniref:uncharacterized protein LOC133194431 n=1 Tax=Saccostrea echinata TaxID=191078 RepID=UPI002A8191B9|nr:uncharacterized protein LOC133194431 [Saccostrea echinata]
MIMCYDRYRGAFYCPGNGTCCGSYGNQYCCNDTFGPSITSKDAFYFLGVLGLIFLVAVVGISVCCNYLKRIERRGALSSRTNRTLGELTETASQTEDVGQGVVEAGTSTLTPMATVFPHDVYGSTYQYGLSGDQSGTQDEARSNQRYNPQSTVPRGDPPPYSQRL